MYLHSWLSSFLGAYTQYTWAIHSVIIFLVALAIYWLQRKICKRLHAHFVKSDYVWDDSFIYAFSLPFSILIWVFALTLFAEFILVDSHQAVWAQEMVRVRIGCFILLLVWFLWRYIAQIEYRLVHPSYQKKKVDATTVSVVGRFVRIGVGIAALLILLEAFGIPLSGLIAFGGGGAIVMGIAAQQLLANWFGGLMIFLDKPFRLGDWIQSPDRDIEGRVTRIGWRTTKMITLDHRAMYIPNALFNQIVITNPQRMTHRRIDATIGIRYEDAGLLKNLVQAIEAMLRQHPHVDQRELVMVHMTKFGTSSLDVNVYCFSKVTDNPHWRNVQQDIFFEVIDIVAAHNAQFAYPTVTTHIPNGIALKGDSRS
jgi:MscS family membrane protein